MREKGPAFAFKGHWDKLITGLDEIPIPSMREGISIGEKELKEDKEQKQKKKTTKKTKK
jgi:hypothetical protein